jgi:adenylate cyclase
MQQVETRKLAAIMFTDIVGFSRQMGSDEARMLQLLEIHNRLIRHAVSTHHGYVIKTIGDAFLVDFPSVVHAVQCAQAIQSQLRTRNTEQDKAEQIHVRIGIHLGDVVQRDGDVFGDGVNIASRLQTLAEPDTICISDVVYRDVAQKVALGTVVSLGRPQLKNITQRFHVYALLPETSRGLRRRLQAQRLKLSHWLRPGYWVAAGVVVALIVGGFLATQSPFFFLLRTLQSPIQNQTALPLPDKPSIVVLPFVNMSNDPEQEYFGDGITEDITTDLSRISSLFVISRNSAFTYKGNPVKVQEVSKELGVQYVLEGSVRKAGDQVRVTTQLIDAITGGHLWSERYDRPLADIFALQDEIVQKIVFALKVKLTPEEQERFKRVPTNSLEAYDYFLRSSEFGFPGTKEANVQIRQMCERALELDPQYAAAYARLSQTFLWEWFSYGGQEQTLNRASDFAQKAVALDESLSFAHFVLGWVYVMQKQHDHAQTEMERAITLDPNFAAGYEGLAFALNTSGKPQEAISAATKAVRLAPQHVTNLNALGSAYVSAGQYEEAITIFKKILARNPDFWPAHFGLAISYSGLGREGEAKTAGAEILRIIPNFSVERWKQRVFNKDPAVTERWAAALHKAGLK